MWCDAGASDAPGMTTVLETKSPTKSPSRSPSKSPSRSPSKSPSRSPSKSPSRSPSKSPSRSPGKSPWRLRGRARKTVLVAHILSVGTWVGVDVLVAVLVLAGWFSGDTAVRAAAYQALGTFVVWPMLTAGLASLVTGVVLGLGSRYGLVRYWWVAVKLALNVVLCTLIVVLLRPELGEVAEYGRAVAAGTAGDQDLSTLFFPPAVSLAALTLATVLSVAKPWGRLRRGRT
jgi:hypothetical protein